jgi:hypothetical protein
MSVNLSLESARPRFRFALLLAIVADLMQLVGFPLFAEGAMSPVDDILDIVLALILTGLLGWQWEFMPSFIAKLVPGVDLVPFWTLAVINVYRKWKHSSQADVDVMEKEERLLKD